MLLRTRCFLAGSTHFCKTVRLDFGFCLDSAGLVFGNSFLAGAAERTERLEPQVITFWFRKVLQAAAKCFHRQRSNWRRHLLQSLGKTRTGMFHAALCRTMPPVMAPCRTVLDPQGSGRPIPFAFLDAILWSPHSYWPSPRLNEPTLHRELLNPQAWQPTLPLHWQGLVSIC